MKSVRYIQWVGVLIVFAALAMSAQSPKLVVPGRWEVTLQNELPYPAPPVTYTVCIEPGAAERPEPPKGKPSDRCKVVEGGTSGNVLSYTARCGSKSSSKVRITYRGDQYEGVVELTESTEKLRQRITARRVGACDDATVEQE
ncbi:MAG TPA: DUF3617 family protein [Thermoanaerobaculia bacterium]|nr:DUF3617 family protein [Thermoanaerobaculia bacterium]